MRSVSIRSGGNIDYEDTRVLDQPDTKSVVNRLDTKCIYADSGIRNIGTRCNGLCTTEQRNICL